jgi:hypothetical protein
MKVIIGVFVAGLAILNVSGRPDQRNEIAKDQVTSEEIIDFGTIGIIRPPVEKPTNVDDKGKASKCGYEVNF